MIFFPFLEPPIFTSKPPAQVALKRGEISSLCCEATGSPLPRIEWSRAQQSSDVPLGIEENGCLEVNTVIDNSEGNYICRATNRFGLAETKTTVIIMPSIGWVSVPYQLTFVDCVFILLFRNLLNNVYASATVTFINI